MPHHHSVHHLNCLNSFVHHLDARVKIGIVFIFILLAVTTPPPHLLTFTLFAGILLWSVALSHIPLSFIAARAAIVLPFSALIALGLPFIDNGETIDFLSFDLSLAGLWLFWGATIKALLCASSLLLLITTTPFSHLMQGLRQLGLSSVLIDMLALTYRYIFVLTEEGNRLRRAAFARGYSPKWLPQSIIIGRLIGTLFLRSYERAERVYGAMLLRGYNGQLPAQETMPLPLSDKLVFATSIVTLCAIRFFVK